MYGRTRSGSRFKRSRTGRSSTSSRSRRVRRRTRGRVNWGSSGPTPGPAIRTRARRTRYDTLLGLRPGAYPSKKSLVSVSNSALLDKKLYNARLVQAPYSDSEKMNSRQGRLANVKGVKFRCWYNLKNQAESSDKLDEPLMCRWAIVVPKTNTGELVDVTTSNFFINANPAGEEATDFPLTGNCFKYQNRQINRRKYGVMQQGKFVLAQNPASTNSRLGMSAHKLINLWLPINKQMKWADNVGTHPNTNIHFLCWYTKMGDKDTAVKFTDGPIDFHWEANTYFKDSLGFN